MAGRLGMDHSTYVFYERADRFKKRNIPVDFARQIASVLADHAIDPDEVMALADVDAGEAVGPTLSIGEARWLEIYRAMSIEQRRLIVQVAEQIVGQKPSDSVHQQAASFRAGPAFDENRT